MVLPKKSVDNDRLGISTRKGAPMATYQINETATVNGVEVKIVNTDGSWITHDFPASTIEEVNQSLRALSAILYPGQSISATIY
jgi:hypothetical protein